MVTAALEMNTVDENTDSAPSSCAVGMSAQLRVIQSVLPCPFR